MDLDGLLEDAAAPLQSAEKHADMMSLGLDSWSQTSKLRGSLAAVLWNQELVAGRGGGLCTRLPPKESFSQDAG